MRGDADVRTAVLRLRPENLGGGLAAIAISIALFYFVNWVKSIGYIWYLAYAIPAAAGLSLLSSISPKFRVGFLNTVSGIETLEENRVWIIGFLFALFYSAILYGFLFAEHGVLCILHLRPCGS